MKKYGVMLVFIWVTFLIQSNIFPFSGTLSINPNLMVILVVALGLHYGELDGLIAGVIAGAYLDLFWANVLCYYALPYMYIGLIAGYFKKYLNIENFIIPALFSGVGDLMIGLYIFVFSFAMRNRLNLGFYLKSIIIPEVLYTIVLSLVAFRAFILVQKRLDLWIDRRGKK